MGVPHATEIVQCCASLELSSARRGPRGEALGLLKRVRHRAAALSFSEVIRGRRGGLGPGEGPQGAVSAEATRALVRAF